MEQDARGLGWRSRLRPTPSRVLVGTIFIGSVVLWEFLSQNGIVSSILFPPPTEVVVALVNLLSKSWYWRDIGLTLSEIMSGFFIGSGVGLLLAVFLAYSGIFRRVIQPYVVTFQVLPKIALAPIFVTWFGFGITSKIVMAASLVFFPVLVNTLLGLESVEPNALLLMRSLVADKRQVFLKLRVPTALPSTMAGLQVGITLAMIGAIVAEFVNAQQGLGVTLKAFTHQLQVASAMAALVTLAIIGSFLYYGTVWLGRRVVFWRST